MFFLQEDVQTLFILSQRMSGHLVDELFQSSTTSVDKVGLENAVVTSKGNVSLPAFARQLGHYNFAVSFQFIAQPLEIAVPTTDDRLLVLENGQIGLSDGKREENQYTFV